MDEQRKQPNQFVRWLISIFCLLILFMVLYRFFNVEPKGDINAGVITLLCILLVLVLSESFDNFSIGKILSVSREVKKKEQEVEKLERKNENLLSQLITISNSQSQTQSHTNVYGDYHATPTVEKANEDDVQEKKTSESSQEPQRFESPRARTNWRKVEEIAISKYAQHKSIHISNVIVEAKLVYQFQGIDPISSMQTVFDAYIKENDHETFVEFRPSGLQSMMFRDRLYVMLSKINHYRLAKRVDAHLDLVLLKLPTEDQRSSASFLRMLESFEPAIASGLLKIQEIELSEEEADSCREQ